MVSVSKKASQPDFGWFRGERGSKILLPSLLDGSVSRRLGDQILNGCGVQDAPKIGYLAFCLDRCPKIQVTTFSMVSVSNRVQNLDT